MTSNPNRVIVMLPTSFSNSLSFTYPFTCIWQLSTTNSDSSHIICCHFINIRAQKLIQAPLKSWDQAEARSIIKRIRSSGRLRGNVCEVSTMSDNESDMTPVPMEETSPVAAASDLVLCFELVWDSDKIELYNDEEGKQRWRCHHCGGNWSGKNHTKALRQVFV